MGRSGRPAGPLMGAAIALALFLLSPPPTATAEASTALAPGAVTAVYDPGVTLAVPADGRLNGYRFAGQVLGAAVGPAVPSLSIKAASGQRLWVFGLRWTADPVPADPSAPDTTYSPSSVTAALVYNGQRVPIPLTPPATNTSAAGTQTTGTDTGPEYFVASVPSAAPDVVVEMSSAGYAQDFSLTHMTREGAQPAALYRQATGWQTTADLQAEKDLPTPYDDGSTSLPAAQLVVKLPDVTLSYFGPDGPTDPAPISSQAWLVPDLQDPLQSPTNPGNSLEYGTNVTAADMTLTLPDGTAVHPQALPGGPDPQQWTTDGSTDGRSLLFPYRYAFPVPADLTRAILTIAFPPELAVADSASSGVTVRPGPAVFPITLPPPSSPNPPPGAASSPAPIRLTTSAKAAETATHGGSHGSDTPLIAALAAVATIGAALAWGLLHRRRLAPATATTAATGPPGGTTNDVNPTDHVEQTVFPHPNGATPHPPTADPNHADATAPADPVTVPPAPPSSPEPGRLADIPDGPPPAGDDPRVDVLGPVTLVGWPHQARPGQTSLELLTFLALHPGQTFTAEQLRNTIGRGRTRDLDTATIRRYIGELRRALGDRVPETRRGGGYQVNGVASDALDFARHLDAARQSTGPAEQARHLVSALHLVRATPFLDSAGEAFGWAGTGEQLAAELSNRILHAAVDLADLALTAGDPALAQWAAHQGSRVWPGDEALDERTLRAAAMVSTSRLDQAWSAVESRLVAGEKVEPSPHLRSAYRSLRQQLTLQ